MVQAQKQQIPAHIRACSEWTARVAFGGEEKLVTLNFQGNWDCDDEGQSTFELLPWAPGEVPLKSDITVGGLEFDLCNIHVDLDSNGTPLGFRFEPHIHFPSEVEVRHGRGIRRRTGSSHSVTVDPVHLNHFERGKFVATLNVPTHSAHVNIEFSFYPAKLI